MSAMRSARLTAACTKHAFEATHALRIPAESNPASMRTIGVPRPACARGRCCSSISFAPSPPVALPGLFLTASTSCVVAQLRSNGW